MDESTLVIQYYPGKDRCNSSGSISSVKSKYKTINRKILRKDNHVPFIIYKNDEGLEPYKKVVKWYEDYNQTIEKLFFPLHYNCSSFVIIKSNGAYFSYKGAYSNNQLFTVLGSDELLNK